MVVPTKLKVLRGNPGRRPIRPEPQPLTPDDIPTPPGYLGEHGRREWARMAPELLRLGLLTVADVQPFAAYCLAYDRWATAETAVAVLAAADPVTRGLMLTTANGNQIQNPLVCAANKAARDMIKFASEFGLTPASRRHLASNADRPAAKFDGLT